jgi:hypothetical protein
LIVRPVQHRDDGQVVALCDIVVIRVMPGVIFTPVLNSAT